jgi:hypothetical protein
LIALLNLLVARVYIPFTHTLPSKRSTCLVDSGRILSPLVALHGYYRRTAGYIALGLRVPHHHGSSPPSERGASTLLRQIMLQTHHANLADMVDDALSAVDWCKSDLENSAC